MSTTRIYLMRHGQSAVPDVFHGAESDIHLSELGHRQADAAAAFFADRAIDVVVSSDMKRAKLTAAPIAAACGVGHEIEPELHERKVGSLSGTPTGVTTGVWPETLSRWVAGDEEYAPERMESFAAIRRRVRPAWDRVAAKHEGEQVVLVAHGVVCKVLTIDLIADYSVHDYVTIGKVENTAMCEFVQENEKPWQADLPFRVR